MSKRFFFRWTQRGRFHITHVVSVTKYVRKWQLTCQVRCQHRSIIISKYFTCIVTGHLQRDIRRLKIDHQNSGRNLVSVHVQSIGFLQSISLQKSDTFCLCHVTAPLLGYYLVSLHLIYQIEVGGVYAAAKIANFRAKIKSNEKVSHYFEISEIFRLFLSF